MKQLQFTFKKESELEAEIRKIRQWCKSNFCSTLLIQVFTEILDRETIQRTCALLQAQMPEAVIVGCSSKGYTTFVPDIDTDYNKVFKRADEAMYRDKAEYYKTHDRRRG